MVRLLSLLLRCCPPLERRLKTRARCAIESRKLADLKACLDWGLPVDAVIPMGWNNRHRATLLGFATQRLFVEGVDFLIAAGANPNARIQDKDDSWFNPQDGKPPLFFLSYFYFGDEPMPPKVRACAVSLLRAGAEVGEASASWDADWQVTFEGHETTYFQTFEKRISMLFKNERTTWETLVEQERLARRQDALETALPQAVVPEVTRARF